MYVCMNAYLEKSIRRGEEFIHSLMVVVGYDPRYVQKGLEEVGLNLYYKMRQTGFIPDQYTFASVFRACATLATLKHGKQAHGVMIKCQIRENVVVNSALMDMYSKCSSLSDGHRVIDKSLNRNVVMWTALISGYVLSACSHGGLLDEGWAYFSSMTKDYGIQPRGKHYAAIVDLLGCAGRLQEAYEFVLNSPWFMRHEIGKEPENSGKYVVLCNAYATFGFWENAAEVRAVMRESGIIKEPSYSRIEVQNGSQFFFKGDKQSNELHELIREMTCILKYADVIGIDEAQLFEDLYDFCREAADHDGQRVIVAGLDGNYLSERAFFTLRKTEETQTELIGGADVYMPVCRQHYVSRQVVKEAAKTVLESQNVQCVSYA
ncbi:hypothetical protein SO802_022977 [Lithocarpus litseifolius]|uniref:thymidine kinase n=1 Tax=Lithocarpus litseifolius TaxID=425828 RepID=A0AAW2C8U4_9ROSI